MANSTSFTTSGSGLLNVLINNCGVAQAFDITNGGVTPAGPTAEFQAIWDTGATNSVINQRVVDACGLVPIGMTMVNGVGGQHAQEVFLVSIFLPNKATFPTLRVTKGELGNVDLLIGMDIIGSGDFAVTNHNGITKFSFRCPSTKHIDFVAEHNNALNPQRFAHGPGKRKKRNR